MRLPCKLELLVILMATSRQDIDDLFSMFHDGQIKFNANDFVLFDQGLNSLSLDKMKGLATMWWDSIQKMWDDEANKSDNRTPPPA